MSADTGAPHACSATCVSGTMSRAGAYTLENTTRPPITNASTTLRSTSSRISSAVSPLIHNTTQQVRPIQTRNPRTKHIHRRNIVREGRTTTTSAESAHLRIGKLAVASPELPLPHGFKVRMEAVAFILPSAAGFVKFTTVRIPPNGSEQHIPKAMSAGTWHGRLSTPLRHNTATGAGEHSRRTVSACVGQDVDPNCCRLGSSWYSDVNDDVRSRCVCWCTCTRHHMRNTGRNSHRFPPTHRAVAQAHQLGDWVGDQRLEKWVISDFTQTRKVIMCEACERRISNRRECYHADFCDHETLLPSLV
eukprot:COSAG02_NODE_547_length_20492_cov_265.508802_21_plen_305_part_00